MNFNQLNLTLALRRSPKMKVQGMDIVIENPAGSVRSGVDADGKPWSVRMTYPYGYIKRATGADGEGLDCFVGPNPNAADVFVVHQNKLSGDYDEDKCMIGFDSPENAKIAYLLNYNSPRFFRSMTIVPIDQFKEMLTTAKPGGATWKKKNGRTHATEAMFSADIYGECCPHCQARQERSDDGNCNRCGTPWPLLIPPK